MRSLPKVIKLVELGEEIFHIPDSAPGRHRTERDDLRNVFRMITAADILNRLSAPRRAKIHVKVGHGYAIRV